MIARQEKVKVIYNEPALAEKMPPMAVILTDETTRFPVVYRLSRLNVDELGNLFESGDPDQEGDIVAKHGKL